MTFQQQIDTVEHHQLRTWLLQLQSVFLQWSWWQRLGLSIKTASGMLHGTRTLSWAAHQRTGGQVVQLTKANQTLSFIRPVYVFSPMTVSFANCRQSSMSRRRQATCKSNFVAKLWSTTNLCSRRPILARASTLGTEVCMSLLCNVARVCLCETHRLPDHRNAVELPVQGEPCWSWAWEVVTVPHIFQVTPSPTCNVRVTVFATASSSAAAVCMITHGLVRFESCFKNSHAMISGNLRTSVTGYFGYHDEGYALCYANEVQNVWLYNKHLQIPVGVTCSTDGCHVLCTQLTARFDGVAKKTAAPAHVMADFDKNNTSPKREDVRAPNADKQWCMTQNGSKQ